MENNVSQDAKKTGICVGFSFVTCLVILSLVGFAVLGLFFNGANAQMQYEVHGTIMSTATNYHLIYDVRAGDLLVIGVNPTENGKYFSAVFSPNLTRIGYTGSVNLYSENVPVGGTHSYQFIANATGNYVLRIWTTSSAFNYTTKVSHKVSTGDPPQATPYNTPGEINATSTSWHTIQNVKANDLVLISVNLIEGGSCFFHSLLSLASASRLQGRYQLIRRACSCQWHPLLPIHRKYNGKLPPKTRNNQ